MIRNYLIKRSPIKKILIIAIIAGFIGIIIPTFTHYNIPLVYALDETIAWNITLRITETSGTGNTVVFGEKLDASDDLDQYDLPEPPAPPQLPYIRTWFETSFTYPFNNLLQEFKSSSSNRTIWNVTIVWVAAPENQSHPTVSINWDSPLINTNLTHSLLLYENDVNVANMITENSYSFLTNSSLHRFQIIYQRETSHNNGKPMELPILPYIISGVVCIVIISIAIFFLKRKKN